MMTDQWDDDVLFDDPYREPTEAFEQEPEPLSIPPEMPLLTALMQTAVDRLWHDDRLMQDFVECVLPQLIGVLALLPAKGGDFAAERAEQGLDTSTHAHDQSLRAHILNGLLATLRIHQLAVEAGSISAGYLGDYGRRLIIATYALHDYTKLPVVKDSLGGQLSNPSREGMSRIREILDEQAQRLNLYEFFVRGGSDLHLADLIYAVHNTQVKWGVMPSRLLAENLTDSRLVLTAAGFSRIADLLAYGTFLESSTLDRINQILVETLAEPPFKLTAHRVTQITGILTAYVNNGVIQAMRAQGHMPILFAPNGVIYASPPDSAIPDVAEIAERVVQQVTDNATRGIQRKAGEASAIGIAWGTQGIKVAPFIVDMFPSIQTLALIWKNLTRRLMSQPRKPEGLKAYKKLEGGVERNWTPWFAPEHIGPLFEYIDERAEALGDWLTFAYALKPAAAEVIVTALGFDLDQVRPLIETAQSGGVQFWPFLLSVQYISQHPRLSPQEVDETVTSILAGALADALSEHHANNRLREQIRQHVLDSVVLPRQPMPPPARFSLELERYGLAKMDRQRGIYDTILNTPYNVEPQQDATLPYMPTPYSQRLPLGAGDSLDSGWRRGISGIGVINMLLMQLALRQPFAFEERKGKMLFVYPVYYFTPETGDVLRNILSRLHMFNVATWLRHTRRGRDVDARTVATYHAVLDKPEKWMPPIQAMRYPVTIAPTMAQIAVDPGKDVTDVESWVNAVFITLILAAIVDVKIVVSESPVPLYQSGLGFNETVLLDAPHAAFKDLIGAAINVDRLLPALQRITILLAVCVDGYGFEFNMLAGLGRKLAADPANVFEVYGRLRDGKDPSTDDARRYIEYAERLQETATALERSDTLNHARELVTRYRRFYRARGYAANAILRPIQAAQEVILQAETAHSDPNMLVDEICGRLIQIDTAIVGGDTQGFTPRGTSYQERYAHMRDFSDYFVHPYYQEALKGRKSSLRGTQFNLLRLACDAVYRDLEASTLSERNVWVEWAGVGRQD